MNRFLLFAGNEYYPAGGWHDFKGSFTTIEAAEEQCRCGYDWWHIVDSVSGKRVKGQSYR